MCESFWRNEAFNWSVGNRWVFSVMHTQAAGKGRGLDSPDSVLKQQVFFYILHWLLSIEDAGLVCIPKKRKDLEKTKKGF